MNRFHPRVLAATTIVVAAACSDATGPAQDATLADAFSTVLLGFNNVESSFAGGREAGLAAWSPGGGRREAQSGELCAGRAGWVIPGWHRIRPRSHQSIGVQRLHVRVGIRRRRVRSRGTQWPHRESLGSLHRWERQRAIRVRQRHYEYTERARRGEAVPPRAGTAQPGRSSTRATARSRDSRQAAQSGP